MSPSALQAFSILSPIISLGLPAIVLNINSNTLGLVVLNLSLPRIEELVSYPARIYLKSHIGIWQNWGAS